VKKRTGPIHETCRVCGGDGWIVVAVKDGQGRVVGEGAKECPNCQKLKSKRAKR
jgi:hypothetical protein